MEDSSLVNEIWLLLVLLIEGPLLWIASLTLVIGIVVRLVGHTLLFIKAAKNCKFWIIINNLFGMILPYHKIVKKKFYLLILFYIFHIFLFSIPLWLNGHIILIEESFLNLYWSPLPDAWIDIMTLFILISLVIFLARKCIFADLRNKSTYKDYFFVILTGLPFLTGYLLMHGTLNNVIFLGTNMLTFHILSAEVTIIMAAFLFCQVRIKEMCTGCGACICNCPVSALKLKDIGENRNINYRDISCICCGSCVSICPENAAVLKHVVGVKYFLSYFEYKKIKSVDLALCQKCGMFFVSKRQMEKIFNLIHENYLQICPKCREISVAGSFLVINRKG